MPLCFWAKRNMSWYQWRGVILHFTCSVMALGHTFARPWVFFGAGRGSGRGWERERETERMWMHIITLKLALALEMLFIFLPYPVLCSLILSLNSFLAQCLMWPHCLYSMTSLFSSCKAQQGNDNIHLGRHCSSRIRAILSPSLPFISLLFECMWYECVSSSVSFPWGFFQ